MSSEQVGSLLPFVLIVAGVYFLLIRPTRKRAREVDALQKALSVGSDVMLTSGIFAQVQSIDDEMVQVEVAPGVVVTVHRGAIAKVVTPAPEPEPETGNDVDPPDVEPDDPDSQGAH